jgi:hypothetical protein
MVARHKSKAADSRRQKSEVPSENPGAKGARRSRFVIQSASIPLLGVEGSRLIGANDWPEFAFVNAV